MDVAEAFSDANWAGCRQSRKSTSVGVLKIGQHPIKAYSKTQATIAKSSAESELFGIVRANCEALGFLALATDFGKSLKSCLHMDANAAQSIIDRHGLSKVRHLDVNMLWLQEQLIREKGPLIKIPGPYNCADLMTKHVAADLIKRHTGNIGLEFREGRTDKAARLQSVTRLIRQKEANDKMLSACENMTTKTRQDKWSSRGAEGEWTRIHSTPRKSLFTPCRVARGPAHPDKFECTRLKVGINSEGEKFEVQDNWREPGRAHRVLSHPWTGYTKFKIRRVQWADE